MNVKYLETCINEYGRYVYSFCTYLTRNRQDADDLYQQVFLTAMEKDEISEDKNPKSYLITIAANIWNNHKRKYLWRKQKADVVYLQNDELGEILQDADTPEDSAVKNEELAAVRQLVYELPYKMKLVVLMFYMEDMSIEQIAGALNIPAGTVKSRLHQAKERLRERLVDEYEKRCG